MADLEDDEKSLIERARAQFKVHQDEERTIRDEAEIDIRFRAGDQWDKGTRANREETDRPALTFDKTHVYIQSVANEARQNKPQPRVNPIGGGATTDVATVINGILRHVHYRSMADVAYDTALDYSCGSSFGYVRAITEYARPGSFDQELRILPVLDPFTIYGVLIPACRGQVCKNAFVVQNISRAEYKRLYGKGPVPVDFESTEWRNCGDWIDSQNVRIAEYWWVEEGSRTLRHVLHADGSTTPIYTDQKNYNDRLTFVTDEAGDPLEREEETQKVCFCKMDGTRILPKTKTEWVGNAIPIEAVLGQQLMVDGEIHLFSLIRFIRDTQRLINIYASAIAEKIGLANRVPYLGYKGQFKDPKWLDCNVVNYPYLEVEPVMIDGKPAPLPQRQQLEEQISALSQALAIEIDSLKSGMGIYDASLGARSNETSGAGIRSRQQQSNVTNFHFSDNLNRAQWALCLKLLPCIAKVYDRPGRQVRIVGEDQEHSVVVVNQTYRDPETGKSHTYMLDVGDYDVVVTVGPSYTTARQEGADTLQQFFTAAPQAVPLLGDLWVANLDYPWSREAARRLKLAAPQNIVQEQGGDQQIPPQVQQQMAQMNDVMKQLTGTVHTLQNEIDAKKVECDSRERIAAMQEETKRTLGIAALDQKDGVALLMQEVAALNSRFDLAQTAHSQLLDHAHEAGMAAQEQEHERQQAAAAQQAAAEQATQAQNASAASQDSAQQASAEQATQAQNSAAELAAQKTKLPKAA